MKVSHTGKEKRKRENGRNYARIGKKELFENFERT